MSDQDVTNLIVERLGLGSLSLVEQELALSRLNEQILRRATLDIWDKLPVEDREELAEVVSIGDDENIIKFLRQKLGVIEVLLQEAARNQIKDFLAE